MSQDFPTKQFPALFHVGTLVESDKGCRGPSLEGAGLSVSEHPQAWRSIARLGGLPTWRLSKARNCFLDIHRMQKEHWARIEGWGVAQGLATPQDIWVVKWHDEELGHDVSMEFVSQAAAQEEMDEGRVLSMRRGLAPAAALERWAGQKVAVVLSRDFLGLSFAENVLGVDGVFWNDTLDIHGLSAPRAVIFSRGLPNWSVTREA